MPTGPLSLVPGIMGQGAPICQTCAMPNSFPWLTHTASHPHSSTHYTADRWQWTGIACQACCFTRLRVHPCLDLTLSTPVCCPPIVGWCSGRDDAELLWHVMVSSKNNANLCQNLKSGAWLINKWIIQMLWMYRQAKVTIISKTELNFRHPHTVSTFLCAFSSS